MKPLTIESVDIQLLKIEYTFKLLHSDLWLAKLRAV